MAKETDYYLWMNEIPKRQKNVIVKAIHKNNGRLSIRLTYQDFDDTEDKGILKLMTDSNIGTVADEAEMKTKLTQFMDRVIIENLKKVPENIGESLIKKGEACVKSKDKSKYETIDLNYITSIF